MKLDARLDDPLRLSAGRASPRCHDSDASSHAKLVSRVPIPRSRSATSPPHPCYRAPRPCLQPRARAAITAGGLDLRLRTSRSAFERFDLQTVIARLTMLSHGSPHDRDPSCVTPFPNVLMMRLDVPPHSVSPSAIPHRVAAWVACSYPTGRPAVTVRLPWEECLSAFSAANSIVNAHPSIHRVGPPPEQAPDASDRT